MGVGNSRRRDRMDDSDVDTEPTQSPDDSLSDNPDLTAILAYLIRSGQVRILGGEPAELEEYVSDDDSDIVTPRPTLPVIRGKPDTSRLDKTEFKQQILTDSGRSYDTEENGIGIPQLLRQREIGKPHHGGFSKGACCGLSANFLPNTHEVIARYQHKAFCGVYSQDGNVFLSACQDHRLRIYDTTRGRFQLMKTIPARNVGWSVLDTAFSPDGNNIIYSSWSDAINLCSIHPDHDTHRSLHLNPDTDHSFCIFSLVFSSDNTEIMGGANDGCLYVFDRERNERTLKIDAHEDDVNAVAFADGSSNILFSGADDGLCKVWDRRTLRENEALPVGVLAGHTDGITFIDSKNDGRHLISNSKDQSIKLWDIRKFASQNAIGETRKAVSKQTWDYRWQQAPFRLRKRHSIKGDTSLMTYHGHCIQNTLVRCRFSPQFTTGQRYIYTGCATGGAFIYDILTGKQVSALNAHVACVRDVSWHPYDNTIMTTSWDRTIAQWSYQEDKGQGSSEDGVDVAGRSRKSGRSQ